jgi:hypothetical protein
VLRELITRPVGMVASLLDLPRTLQRSVREANSLMEISREQLEMMRRQADEALVQAERMNDLLERVVRLTEPLERAQRSAEDVTGRLKQMLFGEEGIEAVARTGRAPAGLSPQDQRAEELTQQAQRAEEAAIEAETAAEDAETAAEDAEAATEDGTTIRVVPNRPRPEGDDAER